MPAGAGRLKKRIKARWTERAESIAPEASRAREDLRKRETKNIREGNESPACTPFREGGAFVRGKRIGSEKPPIRSCRYLPPMCFFRGTVRGDVREF